MTALITIITLVPVALAPRTGMDAYQPLGAVIVGGLIVGTIMSLIDIPIMHTLIDDLGTWIRNSVSKQKPEISPSAANEDVDSTPEIKIAA